LGGSPATTSRVNASTTSNSSPFITPQSSHASLPRVNDNA
jgi:hypothetical protein